MSHNFKSRFVPAHESVTIQVDSAKVKRAIEEDDDPAIQEAKLMAMLLHNDQELEELLLGAAPEMRDAMLEMIGPYLSFQMPDADIGITPDCPYCGLRRGSVIPHECLGAS